MKKKVLVTATNYSLLCSEAKALLEQEGFEVIENTFSRPFTFEELKERVSDICGVVAGVDTWNENVFKLAPGLKAIGRFGIGVDNIDLEAAKRYGIKVTNARGINSDSVAECTVGLILSVLRNIVNLDGSTRLGKWERYVGNTIRGKKIGLVGFGAIARYTARLLSAFDTEIYAYDIYPNHEAAKKLGVTITDLDTIIKQSDIITLHVPCTPETTKLFGSREFGMMKDSAIIINVARGPVIDESALYTALKEKKIAGAGVDVYEVEPAAENNPLFELKNIVCLPHSAAETYETYRAVGLATARAVIDVMNGREPDNWLNR